MMKATRAGLTLAILSLSVLAVQPAMAADAARIGARSFAQASPNGLVLFAMGAALIAFLAVAFAHWRLLTRAIDRQPRAVRRRSALR